MTQREYDNAVYNTDDIADFIYEYRHGILDSLGYCKHFLYLFVGPAISLGLEVGNRCTYIIKKVIITLQVSGSCICTYTWWWFT
jgi:hypothetical protein